MTIAPTAHALDVPGARLYYETRGEPDANTLVLIGSPMDSRGFVTLSSYFEDRPVVTYDPRGVNNSTRTDDATESTPAQHADDLHRLIEALGVGPVDLFASSGGAVNALALVATHPDDVRTLIAHEPPVLTALPDDAEQALAASRDISATYAARGQGPAMAKFIALIMHDGLIEGPMPDLDPAQFGFSAEDDGSRDDALLGQNLRTGNAFVPDYAAVGAASTHVVVAAGVESGQTLAARTAFAVAERLGIETTMFPSHHAGFLGGEFGQHGDPEAFAPALREALAR